MTTRRQLLTSIPAAGAAFALSGSALFNEGHARAQQPPEPLPGHFHPKGKAPSSHTLRILEEAKNTLPFDDTRDFDEFNKGFIARREDPVIASDSGGIAWDDSQWNFVDGEGPFDAIHPSLLRIARLNRNFGLYEVVPGIYQVRGFDLAQTTFVRGKTGWIVFDVLVSAETMRAAWELFQQHRGEGLPVSAVVYSHNHGDHWGGVRGILTDEDVASGRVPVIAPAGFMENAISENVFAGNAMNRRLFYQYGILLPINPYGYVTQGLGPRVSAGSTGLVPPTRLVSEPIEEFEVDGVAMVLQNTPNTEAPSEMNTWIPQYKTLWMAENINATLHNIYTLRGAPVRDALRWSKYINEALYRFADEAEVMIASHHWPRWGRERIKDVLRGQRDIYAHMNNQVLHLANQGVTINQVHNVYEVPKGLQMMWYARGYHGTPQHNSRGVIQRFLGFWDCNPATLIPLSPADSAPLYVEMMGGAGSIMARARALHDEGSYLLATEILNKLVQAEPQNQDAKDMLADAFEQIGYQQENPGLRNAFLSGAYELRSGIPSGETADTSSPEVIRGMSTEQWLNFLGIKLDSRKAGEAAFKINLATPDNGESFVIELVHGTLTNIQGFTAADADLSLALNRSDLSDVMSGAATFEALLGAGKVKVEGDISILARLAAMMGSFDPRFEIMPGTKITAGMAAEESYEADVGAVISE